VKVVVYLPALNEAQTLGRVLDSIPTSRPGVWDIERIVIDDGSTDGTAAVAASHGASVFRHAHNLGTGRAFVSGVSRALEAGADVIVSMDADGQFRGEDISALVAPIASGDADVVLCSRFKDRNLVGAMPWPKRFGNHLLTRIVSAIAGRRFTDVSCGFRAFSKEAGLRVDIHSDFEYIHESLLNWSRCGLRIEEVALPVLAERVGGGSRIMHSLIKYGSKSFPVLVRAIRDYSPLKFFGLIAALVLVPALALGGVVLVHWLKTGETVPYTSFITVSVGGVLLAFLLAVVALLADLVARLRFQVEELLVDARRARTARSEHDQQQP
jgi:glycosyltransferase involved in cell wall biosynthesis